MATTRPQRYTATAARFGALAIGATSLGFACSSPSKPATGLEVIVSTNLAYPNDYDAVEIKVTQETGTGVFGTALFDVANSVALPTSVSIAPGRSSDQVARIIARALKGTTVIVEETAQLQIPTTNVLELDVVLGSDCENVSCSALTTCAVGRCKSIVVDPSQLKTYDPNDLNPLVPDATAPSTPLDSGPLPGLDGGTSSGCAAQCLVSGGCFVVGGSPCCISPGSSCPSGGTCTGGFCTGAAGGEAGTSCGRAGELCCGTGCAAGYCVTELSTTQCACVSPGNACGPLTGPLGTCQSSGECTLAAKMCGPGNCGGCCDATLTCQTGGSSDACGTQGAPCQICADAGTCSNGTCEP